MLPVTDNEQYNAERRDRELGIGQCGDWTGLGQHSLCQRDNHPVGVHLLTSSRSPAALLQRVCIWSGMREFGNQNERLP